MERNKNIGLVIAIVILSLIVVGLGGFVVYDKIIKKDNVVEEKTDNNEKGTTKENNEENFVLQKEIVEKFEKLIINIPSINKYENKITDFNTIDNMDKLNMVIEYITNKENKNPYNSFIDKNVTPEFITNEVFAKIFKNKITFENENFYCYSDDNCLMNYDSSNNKYTYNPIGVGYDTKKLYYSKLIDFKNNNNKYELTYIHLFDGLSEGGFNGDSLYTKYNFDYINDTPYIDNSSEYENDRFSNIGSYSEKIEQLEKYVYNQAAEKIENLDNYNDFPKYKYIVELDEDGNPLLSGYEYIEQ